MHPLDTRPSRYQPTPVFNKCISGHFPLRFRFNARTLRPALAPTQTQTYTRILLCLHGLHTHPVVSRLFHAVKTHFSLSTFLSRHHTLNLNNTHTTHSPRTPRLWHWAPDRFSSCSCIISDIFHHTRRLCIVTNPHTAAANRSNLTFRVKC